MTVFPEEQLDSLVGYFSAQPGQTLEGGNWTIIRKLGWGPRSTTWLALENTKTSYRAIKILTVTATEEPASINERNLLLGPVKNIQNRVPNIVNSFYERDTKGKRHLCLVFHVLGSSVEELRLKNIYHGEYLPIHTVQKIIGDISGTLAKLADLKLIHGAVTADNFLFWSVQRADDIRMVLAKSKSERAEKTQGSDGVTYPSVKSQPIPHGYTWDCTSEDIMYASLYLSNYGHALPSPMSGPRILEYRKNFLPPEALQGGRVDLKSDIWMLGCTTYLLVTGSPLFSDSYIASPFKIAKETLGKLERLLTDSGKIAEKDVLPTALFLRGCLAIEPADRASAAEIFDGGWIRSGCSCGWNGH